MVSDSDSAVRRRAVTTADVAKESGVSRATVSYVLNDAPGRAISQATRALVLSTAERMGHVPNASARALRLGRSNIVLALVRDFSIGFIATRVLRRLDVALAARGYLVLAHRLDQEIRSLSELWGIVSPTVVVAMAGLSLPEQALIEGSNAHLVRVQGIIDQRRVGEMQVEYLFSKGHRVLGYAYVDAPTLRVVAEERLAGAVDACARLGIDEPIVIPIDVDKPLSVFPAIDSWLSSENGVSAICAHNDEVAMMLIAGLSSRGLSAGTDLSIIGADNIPIAQISLTTIELNLDAYADTVVASVIAAIDGNEPPAPAADYLRLIVRDSA